MTTLAVISGGLREPSSTRLLAGRIDTAVPASDRGRGGRAGTRVGTSPTVMPPLCVNWEAAPASSQLDVMYGPLHRSCRVNAPVRLRIAAVATITEGPGVNRCACRRN
jgi:hypothetical protein